MLSGFLDDRYFLDSLSLSLSCLSAGTSNNTLMSKSASFLYLFVRIEPINDVFKIGYSDSNSFNWSSICFLTLSFILGLDVLASSNTLGAYVLRGMSMILSNILFLNDITFSSLLVILFAPIVYPYNYLLVLLVNLLLFYYIYLMFV